MSGQSATSLLVPGERLDLLIKVLRFRLETDDLGELRQALLSDADAFNGLLLSASRRQLVPAAIKALRTHGILHPRLGSSESGQGVLAELARAEKSYTVRRQQLAAGLKEVLEVLNAQDIEPVIMKGSVSLISGEPAWRMQRDIDFFVPPDRAQDTSRALKGAGFEEVADDSPRPHHLHPLARNDLPGTLEPHVMLGGSRARSVLPDNLLLPTASSRTWEGLRCQLLSPAANVLHGAAHHYFQNRGYLFGTMSMKGLLEFAFAVNELDETGARQLSDMGASSAHLQAGLSVLLALSEELLALELPPALNTGEAARKSAKRMATRILNGQTAGPVRSALGHARLAAKCKTQGAAAAVGRSLLDASHTAVWFDAREQCRNASGILVDD